METKRYTTKIGEKTVTAEFSKTGTTYRILTWGAPRKILKEGAEHNQYIQWIEQSMADFGDTVGERLFMKSYMERDKIWHSLETMSPEMAREQDLGNLEPKVIVTTHGGSAEAIETMKKEAEALGLQIRPANEEEIKMWGHFPKKT
jgi:hypothetical protein